MAFTYIGDLSTSRDKVRFYLGDDTTADALFTDATIDGALALYGSPIATAAAMAEAQAAKYARKVTMSIDGASINYSDLAKQWQQLAVKLRMQAANGEGGTATGPYVGGVSIADMDTQRDNTDREPSRIEVGEFDYPGTVFANTRGDLGAND